MAKKPMVPFAVPNLTGKEKEYVGKAIASGWVGPSGPFVEQFESAVAAASGRKWAIATVTGSAALHASLVLLYGNGAHDAQVPQYAFPAARNLLSLHQWSVDVLYGAGTNHDVALYGRAPWLGIADCSPAIGNAKTSATVDCYSFAANKTVTCGQGGAICGDNTDIEIGLRDLIRQGHGRSGVFNYRMSNLNAAVGLAQMERLSEFRAKKREIWDRYAAAGLPMIDRGLSRWMSTIKWDDCRPVPKAFESRLEPFGGLSLPCSTSLTEEEQNTVIAALMKESYADSSGDERES